MNEIHVTEDAADLAVERLRGAADMYKDAATFLNSASGIPNDKVGPEWLKLRDDVNRVLTQSGHNLVEVGEAVIKTAEALGFADLENADDLREVGKQIPQAGGWKR